MLAFVEASEEERGEVADLLNLLAENPNLTHKFSFIKTLRFLRGRKRDVPKTYRALCKHDEWRTELCVDKLGDREFSEDSRRKIKSGHAYLMKDGQPVVYIIARFHDKNNRCVEELRDFIIHSFEDALKYSNPLEERMNIVFDLYGFSMKCMDYEVVQTIIHILGFNYPETLHRAFIINCPMLFSACWFVIGPWIDEVTRTKIVFCSAPELTNHIEASTIPEDIQGG
jgi:hypothetical protein